MVATPAKSVRHRTARLPLPALDEGHRTEPEAVFVCGASRSGTTLLRKILETSDRIAIAPENHFVGHVLPREGARYYFRRLGDLADDDTIRDRKSTRLNSSHSQISYAVFCLKKKKKKK